MYNEMTREEAIAWRMEVYGEREAVATNRVDEVINPTSKQKKSYSEWHDEMLDLTYC